MEEVQVLVHLCGVCMNKFVTEVDYLEHVCLTKFTPKDAAHLINSTTPNFEEVSKAALERGAQVAQTVETDAQAVEGDAATVAQDAAVANEALTETAQAVE